MIEARNLRTHMEAEILSQPEIWKSSLDEIIASKTLSQIISPGAKDTEWLFIGCGSSYYVAQAAAATFNSLGLRARAVPPSEILLFPQLTIQRGDEATPLLISRSGRTSELLQAGELLKADHHHSAIAVTCSSGEKLERIAGYTLHTLRADEKSTVMTRSFTSMLLALQYLAGHVAGNRDFCAALQLLPAALAPKLALIASRIKQFVAQHNFADYIFLAQGALFGIAQECTLKVMESSSSYAQTFHTLEFRHGPKSVVRPDVLTTCLLSESGYGAELEMLEEVKELGGATMVVANQADPRARKAADLLIELGLELPELARLAAYVVSGQLLGLWTGLKKGLNPDEPRHLSRVVILNSAV